MAEFQGLPHEVLRLIVCQPLKRQFTGRDQKLYDLKMTAGWAAPGSEDLEIVVRLKRGWFGKTLTDSFRVNAPPSGSGAAHRKPGTDSPDTNH